MLFTSIINLKSLAGDCDVDGAGALLYTALRHLGKTNCSARVSSTAQRLHAMGSASSSHPAKGRSVSPPVPPKEGSLRTGGNDTTAGGGGTDDGASSTRSLKGIPATSCASCAAPDPQRLPMSLAHRYATVGRLPGAHPSREHIQLLLVRDVATDELSVAKVGESLWGVYVAKAIQSAEPAMDARVAKSFPRFPADFEVADEETGVSVIVMEHVRGPSLAQLIDAAEGDLSDVEVRTLCLTMVVSLWHLHVASGRVHSDVAPENIVRRDADGSFVLLDFGSCKPYLCWGRSPRALPGEWVRSTWRHQPDGLARRAYAPLAGHDGRRVHPSDDLESLGYVCAEALRDPQIDEFDDHTDALDDAALIELKRGFLPQSPWLRRYFEVLRSHDWRAGLEDVVEPSEVTRNSRRLVPPDMYLRLFASAWGEGTAWPSDVPPTPDYGWLPPAPSCP